FVRRYYLRRFIQKMLIKQAELREKWKSEGDKWPDIVGNMQTRIGLNTGLMVTGNMGSTRRFNYTIMGDNVNLAARCESGAKMYGIQTMVTQETKQKAEQAGDDCVFRKLDNIVVVGRTRPVTVYEVAGLRAHMSADHMECIALFEQGLHAYFQQNWEKAIIKFTAAAKLEPGHPVNKRKLNPSLVLLGRSEQLKQNPPGDNWNGTYVMQSK
ncbi:MAG: adenylate/guanylate cyclase domain-containing protein, partial [Balneolales bacterium]